MFSSPDSTLTLTKLTHVLKDVDWSRDLNYWLDIPHSKLSSETDKITQLSLWYLDHHPTPSWRQVASALYLCREHEALEVLRDEVPSLKGEPHAMTLHLVVVKGMSFQWTLTNPDIHPY